MKNKELISKINLLVQKKCTIKFDNIPELSALYIYKSNEMHKGSYKMYIIGENTEQNFFRLIDNWCIKFNLNKDSKISKIDKNIDIVTPIIPTQNIVVNCNTEDFYYNLY